MPRRTTEKKARRKLNPKPRSESPPPWFPRLDKPAPYLTVRVPPGNVDEWLDTIIGIYDTPEGRVIIDRDFNELARFESAHARSLARTDWSTFSSYEIIRWIHAHATLSRAIHSFLPPSCVDFPFTVRFWLFLFILISWGREQSLYGQEALTPAYRTIQDWLVAPYVAREVTRRAAQHVGFPAGLLVFLHRIFRLEDETHADPHARLVPESPLNEGALSWTLDQLRARSYRGHAAV